ncbi:MAG: diguanylate cyclase domain-containing protein, partial [Hyphococcus sp.]
KKRRTNEDLGVITMSMGVSAHRRYDSIEELIERADACLYAAKQAGRNRVFNEDDLAASLDDNSVGEDEAGAA